MKRGISVSKPSHEKKKKVHIGYDILVGSDEIFAETILVGLFLLFFGLKPNTPLLPVLTHIYNAWEACYFFYGWIITNCAL